MPLFVQLGYQIREIEANGRTVPILEIVEDQYLLEIKIFPPTPRVGNFHVNVVIFDMVNRAPTIGASVSIIASGGPPDSLTIGPTKAYSTLVAPNSYETTLNIPYEGDWNLILDIRHEDRTIRPEFLLAFVSADVNLELIFVIMCSIPILISVSWYVRRKVYSV